MSRWVNGWFVYHVLSKSVSKRCVLNMPKLQLLSLPADYLLRFDNRRVSLNEFIFIHLLHLTVSSVSLISPLTKIDHLSLAGHSSSWQTVTAPEIKVPSDSC